MAGERWGGLSCLLSPDPTRLIYHLKALNNQSSVSIQNTYQLRKEGCFLGFLRVFFVMIQVILQFQRQCVIITANHAQNLKPNSRVTINILLTAVNTRLIITLVKMQFNVRLRRALNSNSLRHRYRRQFFSCNL